MKLTRLTVLSPEEIQKIHEATLHILEHAGVQVGSKDMLNWLKAKGLPVEADRQIVRFPRQVIEDALALIPPQFEVFDREGKPVFMLGNGVPRIAAGHNAVFWVDSSTGITRPSTVSDIEQFAALCEQLPDIDMIGIPAMPQDVPHPRTSLLYGVKAVITQSRKPIYFSTDSCDINHACIDLLRATFGGNLKDQVYGISQLSPTSPLFWEASVLDALRDTVAMGVPLAILPEPNAGVSSPFTLAGLLTMNNAECLSGLAMTQLLQPGAKVMYANSWTTTDMRSGAALVGSVETTVCRIAAAQLARFYKIPSHTTAPNSDNHAHDEQNAWEKTFSQFSALAAGHDLIVNCGMFATGLTCSNEQLLMDAEISAMARRIVRGVTVKSDTIARDIIETIGPHGPTYLTADHTLEYLHSDEYHIPYLAVRGPRAAWKQEGAKDIYALAREQVCARLKLPACPLENDVVAKLERIIQDFRTAQK